MWIGIEPERALSELGNENTAKKGNVYLGHFGIPLAAVNKLLKREYGVPISIVLLKTLSTS